MRQARGSRPSKMLIIVEGPDGAGKSTLVKRLVAYVKSECAGDQQVVEVLHARPPTRHPLVEYEDALLEYRPGTARHIIADRWHIGEAVYPDLLGRTTQWDSAVAHHIDMFLQSRGALIIYLDPQLPVLKCALVDRGDDMITVDDLPEIKSRYQDAMTSVKTLFFTFGGIISDASLRIVVRTAQFLERHAEVLNGFITYVGSPHPKVLLLGDVRGTEKGRASIPPLAPAFQPYRGTSGHYLIKHFGGRSLIGLANACDVDDVKSMWDVLGRPATVALGNHADNACNDAGIP